MVAASGDERGLSPVPLHQREPEHAAVEVERPVEVGDLQVDVPDTCVGMDRPLGQALARRRTMGPMDRLLQIEDFEPLVGRVFRFKGTRFAFPLDRIAGTDRPAMPGLRRKPFILIFAGSRERDHLPDGLYDCEVDGGAIFQLFVTPIHTLEPERQEYQAVFT